MPSRNELIADYVLTAFSTAVGVVFVDVVRAGKSIFLVEMFMTFVMIGAAASCLCYMSFDKSRFYNAVIIAVHPIYTIAIYTVWVGVLTRCPESSLWLIVTILANVAGIVIVPVCITALVITIAEK